MTATPHPPQVASLSYAPSAAAAPAGSLTLRQYTLTLAWTLAAVGVCAVGYAVEKYLLGEWLGVELFESSLYRFFKNPAELPMRMFGIPHFIVGTLFLLSSRRMRGAKSWMQLAGLALLGIGFCVLFGTLGQDAARDRINPLALLVFYFYFLIHGFRDEAFFYRAYGEMPRDQARVHDRIMVVLQVLLLGLLLSLALPAYVLYGQIRPEFQHPALEAMFPASWSYATRFAACFLPMCLVAVVALWRIGRAFPDGLRGLWRAHRPILTVFLLSTGIILLALISGPWSFNIVVLMHFVGWYLFGRYTLAQHEAREPASRPRSWTWKWMRSTRAGFTWLHLGLAVIVILLAALSTYAFGKDSVLELAIGSRMFYYWTIMHVTLSFFPR